MTYAERLKDPRWQRKRLEVFERDGWKCRFCGDHTSMLIVHHTEYHGSNPWDTPKEKLLTYCETCNDLAHSADGCIHNKLFGTVGCFPACPGFISIFGDGIKCEPSLVAIYYEWIQKDSK